MLTLLDGKLRVETYYIPKGSCAQRVYTLAFEVVHAYYIYIYTYIYIYIVEARKLEHNCPHTLKVKYRGSQH